MHRTEMLLNTWCSFGATLCDTGVLNICRHFFEFMNFNILTVFHFRLVFLETRRQFNTGTRRGTCLRRATCPTCWSTSATGTWTSGTCGNTGATISTSGTTAWKISTTASTTGSTTSPTGATSFQSSCRSSPVLIPPVHFPRSLFTRSLRSSLA